MNLSAALRRWQHEGLVDDVTAERIAAFEAQRGSGRFGRAVIGLGSLAILLGIGAVVGANWDAIPAWFKLTMHCVITLGLGIALLRTPRSTAREVLAFLLMGATLTFLALIGQVYQTQSPLWQPMLFWLVVVTPFMLTFARHLMVIAVWCIGFAVTLMAGAEPLTKWLEHTNLALAFFAAIPYLLIGTGQSLAFRRCLPEWGLALAVFGTVALMLTTSHAQILWHMNASLNLEDMHQIKPGLVTGLLGAASLYLLRRNGKLVAQPISYDILLTISPVLVSLPLLFSHGGMPVVGALFFMGYWLVIAWMGLQTGRQGLFNLAVVIIALRLVVVYVEVFGSLLQTGVGLIISGALLIALVLGSRRIIKQFAHKQVSL